RHTGRSNTSRPEGALIWGHATRAEHVFPMCQLAEKLQNQRPDCTLLLSLAKGVEDDGDSDDPGVITAQLPAETTASIESFLEFWKPDFVLWTAGNLNATFVDRIARRNIPLGLVSAEAELLSTSAWRWFKGTSRATLNKLNFVFTVDAASLREVQSLKLDQVDVALGGPFMESGMSLPYREAERSEMAELLLGRPIWLAAHATEPELALLLEAHRSVMRYSHRALLILVPETSADQDDFMEKLEASGLRTIRWSDGDTPGEATQIVLADVEGELGLWYRLAPISFMGNSMVRGMTGSDPNEPAAHGSAILHGPYVGHRASSYARFTEAAAARRVTDAASLAAAVTRLIQPDQSASMAHAAWEVASRGSALADMIADRILDHIDQAGSRP
ncbi:MAG: glycosyltransferase N-terminal domain-containing protein, partial [Pseudomonadota bacterium]